MVATTSSSTYTVLYELLKLNVLLMVLLHPQSIERGQNRIACSREWDGNNSMDNAGN